MVFCHTKIQKMYNAAPVFDTSTLIMSQKAKLIEINNQYTVSNLDQYMTHKLEIADANDDEIARIDKTWTGALNEICTTADNYAVSIKTTVEQPLLSIVVVAAFNVDTALKQDSN